jgi:hypothetical protein
MKSSNLLAAVVLTTTFFAGCKTAVYQPSGFTRREAVRKIGDLNHTCAGLRMNTPVQVSFYTGQIDEKETVPGGVLKGYLYGCNPWTETISVSQKPLGVLDRGESYFLQYVDKIIPVQETALLSPMFSYGAVLDVADTSALAQH